MMMIKSWLPVFGVCLAIGASACALIGPESSTDEFFFEAIKDRRGWNGSAYASFRSADPGTLLIQGVRRTNEYTEDVVGIRLKFSGPGTYVVASEQGFYDTLIGGDVLDKSYRTFGSAYDQVVITRYDSLAKVVEGEMQLRLKNMDERQGDEVLFSLGRFRAKIRN